MEHNADVIHNYGDALLSAARNANVNLDDLLAETQALLDLLGQMPQLNAFLVAPNFRLETKRQFLENTLQGQVSDLYFRFLLLLLKRKRIDHLIPILENLIDLIEGAMGLTPGTVFTAISLSEEEQTRLREGLEQFCGRRFKLHFRVAPEIIGGVRFQFEDRLIDTTIESSLNDLKYRLRQTRLAS